MHLEHNSGRGEFVAAVVAIRRRLMRKRQRVTETDSDFCLPTGADVDNLREICDGTDPKREELKVTRPDKISIVIS